MTSIISVDGLSKSYLLGHQSQRGPQSLRETITGQLRGVARKSMDMLRGRPILAGDEVETFWALKDVSFEVKEGEVFGVIGRNGAGKSTLLKLLSRITDPTEGRVELRGRVASLLEVGTGFHAELTGRENIFLNGAILGMSRSEIKSKFDEIVDFAEVEAFLDTPVKRYSSGMYVRLAFAVAAHLEPEILIIDEVLAVGDVVFQKKCLGRMQSVAASGRTVLFVSHNMQTVAGLTDRSLLLESGKISAIGPSQDVIQRYLVSQSFQPPVFEAHARGTHPEFTRVALKTSDPGSLQRHGAAMELEIEIFTPEPIPTAAISFQILTVMHQPIINVLNLDSEVPMLRAAGLHRLRCIFPRLRLFPGHYYFNFYFGAVEPRREFEAPKEICPFEVAVLDQVRDYYWAPNSAIYVDETRWECTYTAE